MVPLNPVWDRYAELTDGLVQVSSSSPFIVNPTPLSLVTDFLTSGIWSTCYDPVTTAWTTCYSAVVTVWSACYSAVTTIWTKQ